MEKALVTAAIVVIPSILLAIGLKASGRKVEWVPLLWAGFACLVYFLLLRSRGVLPTPDFLQEPALNWFGKVLSLAGTIVMLYFLPRASFQAAGAIWTQNKGSLRPVIMAGGITLGAGLASAIFIFPSPNASVENLLFQATLPGLDEELFFRGLLLLLFHQAFGKGLKVGGADTGWGLWLVAAIFGLLHGVTVEDGALAVNYGAIMFTGFIGFLLTWMRERTGSLVAPILFHNIFNVTMAFV